MFLQVLTTVKKHLSYFLSGLILLVAFIAGTYFFIRYQTTLTQLKKLSSSSQSPTEAQTAQLINEVGKLYILPSGENPTIAGVTDVTKLSNQPFFTHAQNGDEILIYPKAQKAILYRPSAHKIIDVTDVAAPPSSSPNP